MVSKYSIVDLRRKVYDKSVDFALQVYEQWFIPKGQTISLKELKLKEFRDRKKMLNPYQKELLLSQSTNAEELQKLSEKVKVSNMYDFTLTYDRHKGRYGYVTSNFPATYTPNDTAINFANDPDWSVKVQPQRVKLKRWIFLFIFGYWWIQRRTKQVEEFDRIKRKEQRSMQNTEIEELENKRVRFILMDRNRKDFTEQEAVKTQGYSVLWYDAKMKNYLLFLEFLHKKKFIQAKVNAILIVERVEYMDNIEKIKAESKDDKVKADVQVMKIKQLTDQEQLMRTFSESEGANEDDKMVDLDIKKGFFYVINPEGRIIDCAKIYSFLHEVNIFKRITAKISKDIDDRINKS